MARLDPSLGLESKEDNAMMWDYYGGWNWLWMAATMLIFWGGLIALAVWTVRMFTHPRQTSDPAMTTLRQRLAAGELSQEEFERMRRLLQG
jgi:putative membrane protein